jgi:hypothetical protein
VTTDIDELESTADQTVVDGRSGVDLALGIDEGDGRFEGRRERIECGEKPAPACVPSSQKGRDAAFNPWL